MKIRTGFISNSSSANFIVDGSYETLFDLAIAMLEVRNNDYAEWSGQNKANYLTEINEIKTALRCGQDPDTPIFFNTCNYDTYIKKVLGFYIVTTCNNHRFTDYISGLSFCPSEVHKWLEENNYLIDYERPLPFSEDIDSWEFQVGEVFWSPKYDLEFSRYDYMKEHHKGNKDAQAYCKDKDHFADMMVLSPTGEIICPVCYRKELDDKEPPIDNRFDILDL